MGTKLAPSFANPFMGSFEKKYVYTYELQHLIWKRFIDDIFFVWTYGPDELDKFVHYLNGCHKTIKFTIETSSKSINFLDTTVKKEENGSLSTTLYWNIPGISLMGYHFRKCYESDASALRMKTF